MPKLSTNLELGAAYVRVSTDDQTELSPDAQIRVIKEAAKADGYFIPEDFIFVERRGISGRKADNRPEFQRMIAVAKSSQPAPFKRLYLWKFSRFARNQDESTFYKGILRKKCGVEIKSVSEPIAEGMFGRLIETIIEWFDEYYSVNLSGEVLRGMTEKALRHGYQAVPWLGYKAVGHGQPFIIDKDAMKIAEMIHKKYHDGLDMSAIARELNRLGCLTRRGNPFERRTVNRILTNPFYTGLVSWNGIDFQGTHEISPIIAEVFEGNQARIAREYRPAGRREASSCRHWLSGLFKCSVCGATLSFSRSISKKRSDCFQCWRYAKGYHEESNAISVARAEQAVLSSLQEVLSTGQIEYEYIREKDEDASIEEALLLDAMNRLESKERRVKDAYENGIDTLAEYKENRQRLQAERNQLEHDIEQLKLSQVSVPLPETDGKKEILNRIQNVYTVLSDPSIDFATKGNAIRRVVKHIVYDRKSNVFHFYYYV